jgi:hypothetical protein
MEYSKIPVPDGMKSYDISDEHWREYDIVGREKPYRIVAPVALFLRENGGTTHIIVDSEGISHCVPFAYGSGTVLRWSSDRPVSF